MIMCVSVYAYPTRVRVYRYISMLWTGVGRGKKKTACTPRQIGSVYFRVFRRRRDHGGLGEQPRFIHRKNWRSTKSKRLPARVEETRRAVTGGRPDGEVGDGGRNLRFSWSNGSRQLYHKVGMLYLFVYVQYHYRHVNLDVTVDRSFDLIWAFTERNRRKIRAGLRSSNGNILILLRPRHGFLNWNTKHRFTVGRPTGRKSKRRRDAKYLEWRMAKHNFIEILLSLDRLMKTHSGGPFTVSKKLFCVQLKTQNRETSGI